MCCHCVTSLGNNRLYVIDAYSIMLLQLVMSLGTTHLGESRKGGTGEGGCTL